MADSAKEDAKRENLRPDVYQDFVESIGDLVAQKDRLVAKIRNERKRAEGAGVNLEMMDAAIKIKKKDSARRATDEADLVKYLRWMGCELVGYQAAMDLPPPDTSHLERIAKYDAHKQGYAAALDGDLRKANPYDAGTVAFVAWDMGWSDGDNDIFNGAAPKPKAKKAKKGAGPELTGPKPAEPDAETAPDATSGAGDAAAADPPSAAAEVPAAATETVPVEATKH